MIAPTDDIDRLMEVMDRAFDPEYGEAWTRRQVEDALLTGNTKYCLISETGSIPEMGQAAAGFFLARTAADEVELLLLAVNPEFRNRGLGKSLLDELWNFAKSISASLIFLEMRRGNPAEGLYRKSGFRPVGVRPGYYRTTSGKLIDAITFSMNLTEQGETRER